MFILQHFHSVTKYRYIGFRAFAWFGRDTLTADWFKATQVYAITYKAEYFREALKEIMS